MNVADEKGIQAKTRKEIRIMERLNNTGRSAQQTAIDSDSQATASSKSEKSTYKNRSVSIFASVKKKLGEFLSRFTPNKSFAKKSWSVSTVRTEENKKPAQRQKKATSRQAGTAKTSQAETAKMSQARTSQTKLADGNRGETKIYKQLKESIDKSNSHKLLDQIKDIADRAKQGGHITPFQSGELESLMNLKKLELGDPPEAPFEQMQSNATTLKTLREVSDFRTNMIKKSISGDITAAEQMKLQGKLTGQLRTMAQDRELAKGMNMDVLKQLTGNYNTAKDVMKLVTKTLGYTPHKNTAGLEERYQRLKKD